MAEKNLSDIVKQIEELVKANNQGILKLNQNFEDMVKSVGETEKKIEQTQETIKTIVEIAMNTRILGFNASIEASKAKESGKGFGVIAQEVRNISDVSKESADKMEEDVEMITRKTVATKEKIASSSEILDRIRENQENIKEILQGINED